MKIRNTDKDDVIDNLADKVLELFNKENMVIPFLQKQLAEVESKTQSGARLNVRQQFVFGTDCSMTIERNIVYTLWV